MKERLEIFESKRPDPHETRKIINTIRKFHSIGMKGSEKI